MASKHSCETVWSARNINPTTPRPLHVLFVGQLRMLHMMRPKGRTLASSMRNISSHSMAQMTQTACHYQFFRQARRLTKEGNNRARQRGDCRNIYRHSIADKVFHSRTRGVTTKIGQDSHSLTCGCTIHLKHKDIQDGTSD